MFGASKTVTVLLGRLMHDRFARSTDDGERETSRKAKRIGVEPKRAPYAMQIASGYALRQYCRTDL